MGEEALLIFTRYFLISSKPKRGGEFHDFKFDLRICNVTFAQILKVQLPAELGNEENTKKVEIDFKMNHDIYN